MAFVIEKVFHKKEVKADRFNATICSPDDLFKPNTVFNSENKHNLPMDYKNNIFLLFTNHINSH